MERKGIQPVIDLQANGGKKAVVKSGQQVSFTAMVDLPANTGKIVGADWDFEGAGNFPVAGKFVASDKDGSHVKVTVTHTFTKPETYFPTLRVSSQRQGDTKTPFGRIQNMDRVRVVVE